MSISKPRRCPIGIFFFKKKTANSNCILHSVNIITCFEITSRISSVSISIVQLLLCTARTRTNSDEAGNVCAHPVYSRATKHLLWGGSFLPTLLVSLGWRRGELNWNVSSVNLNETEQPNLKRYFIVAWTQAPPFGFYVRGYQRNRLSCCWYQQK